MRINFTIQIDTDDKNVIISQPQLEPVAKETEPIITTVTQEQKSEVAPVIVEEKPEKELTEGVTVQPIPKKLGRPKGSKDKKKDKKSGRPWKQIEPLPEDKLIPEDFNSDNVTLVKSNTIPGVGISPYISRRLSADEYRTEKYPYLGIDVKALMKKFQIGYTELARVIGIEDAGDLRNVLRSDTRQFTKEDYFVILKACNEILSRREMIEDLI